MHLFASFSLRDRTKRKAVGQIRIEIRTLAANSEQPNFADSYHIPVVQFCGSVQSLVGLILLAIKAAKPCLPSEVKLLLASGS
jgi:hypothetical protein